MAPRKIKRCPRGTRKCFFDRRKCVTVSSIKRTKRCPQGERQCPDRNCYKRRYNTRSQRKK